MNHNHTRSLTRINTTFPTGTSLTTCQSSHHTTSMSSCVVSGFFTISALPAPECRSSIFGQFRSTLSGTTHSLGIVYISPPTPDWNEILRDRTVVYVVGTFFPNTGSIPSLLDAVHMDVIHVYQSRRRGRITFPPSYVNAVGTVASEHYYLSTNFLALPIRISQDVWGGGRTYSLTCLISHQDILTRYPRLPRIGSFVHIRGYFSRILCSEVFAVEIDDLTYCFPFGSPLTRPESLLIGTSCNDRESSHSSDDSEA